MRGIHITKRVSESLIKPVLRKPDLPDLIKIPKQNI